MIVNRLEHAWIIVDLALQEARRKRRRPRSWIRRLKVEVRGSAHVEAARSCSVQQRLQPNNTVASVETTRPPMEQYMAKYKYNQSTRDNMKLILIKGKGSPVLKRV